MRHILFDTNTGETKVCGRDGTSYTIDEVAAAEESARRGDKDALAVIDNITVPEPADDQAWLEQILHDCPECRAAMAAGVKPITGRHPTEEARRARIFGKKPRWRDLKRRRSSR